MESASFKDLLVVKTGVKVWSTVAATLFSLLLAAGLVESHIRPSALLPTALVGLYAVYSERQDVLGAATFLLWWSYISDALWFAIGPLGLDAASVATIFDDCAAAAANASASALASVPPWTGNGSAAAGGRSDKRSVQLGGLTVASPDGRDCHVAVQGGVKRVSSQAALLRVLQATRSSAWLARRRLACR